MKRICYAFGSALTLMLVGLALLFSADAQAQKAANARPFTIPAIHQWKGGSGTLALTPQSRIVYADERLHDAAQALARDWQTATGLRLTVAPGRKASAGDVLLAYKEHRRLGNEAYTISIGKDIRVEGTKQGVWHAVQTLLQLGTTLPCGQITDRPDYPLRGLMMDCGRKYIPLSYLRRLARTMAYYKMNTLCVHLNDNGIPGFNDNEWSRTYSAFRLESDRFPGLTAEDGSYTKAEFRQFIADAAALGIEIIPEIDVPAHSLAFTSYRPELASTEFGMDHFDLSNPGVVPFVDSLFAEYLEGPEPVFAGPRVHIGTDEYSNKRQETVEQFRAFTNHLIGTVERYGKQAALWGSLTHAKGDTPVKVDDVLMYSWSNGFANPDSMYRLGYQLVNISDGMVYIVPAAGYYSDYLRVPRIYKEWTPANMGGHRLPDRDPQIKGGLFAVWNDIIGNGISVADIHHRVFPAMQVIAEKCWASDTVRTCTEWQQLATLLGEAPGIDDLGRYPKGTVLSEPLVAPGSTHAISHIGWPYRVSFDIEVADEARGTALFRDDEAEFYLSDPVTGRLGFVRDGYLFSFKHSLKPGTKEHIAIEGDNRETRLYVNNRLVETLDSGERQYSKSRRFRIIRTLRFPLKRTDATLRSKVTGLKAESL